jgi:hypothetical protein
VDWQETEKDRASLEYIDVTVILAKEAPRENVKYF